MNHPRIGMYGHVAGDGFPYIEHGSLVQSRIDAAAKYDDLILDLGCAAERPEIVSALRAANPSIRLHAYVVLQAWNNPNGPTFFQKFWQIMLATNGFLTCTNGKWWSFSNVNVANAATMDALAGLIERTAAEWEGIFIDLLIPQLWSAAQYGGETLDWRAMGFPTEGALLVAWKDCAGEFVKRLKPVTTNYGVGFPATADGNMTEEFDHDFNRWIVSPREGELHLGFPSAWITSRFHSYDPLDPVNERIHRFGIATACLFGGIYSDGRYEGDKRWNEIRVNDPRWFPKDLVHPQRGKGWLGVPTGAAGALNLAETGLWRRDFVNGIALVNPTPAPITYRGADKLRPIGGAAKRAWSVRARDGMLMERV